jgi:hypothetical protein
MLDEGRRSASTGGSFRPRPNAESKHPNLGMEVREVQYVWQSVGFCAGTATALPLLALRDLPLTKSWHGLDPDSRSLPA